MTTTDVNGFYRWASAYPDRVALIGSHIETKTFGQLHGRVNQISHALRGLGLQRGDAVAALLHNDNVYFELALATGQIGLYLVPINTHLVISEIGYIIQNSGAKVVVAHADLAAKLDAIVADLPEHRFSVGGAVEGWAAYEVIDGPITPPEDRRMGALMGYTSGTTGRPKGVRRALSDVDPETGGSSALLVQIYGLTPGDGMNLVCSPLYHAGPGLFALVGLDLGYTIIVHPKFDAEMVLRDIERYRVTLVHMVPTHFHRLLSVPDRERYDVSSLQMLMHAGAPCPVEIKRAMIEWVGPVLWEGLGATEGYVSIVTSREWLTKPGTVGRPGSRVKLLDQDGEEVAIGETGTIYFDTSGAPFEYHDDASKTAGSRIGNLATVGDIGWLDADGYLFLLDRRDDLILSGGVNIYPAEIEGYLILHPSVNDVAVIGIPSPEWGQSVLAIVQPVPGIAPDEALREELAAYAAEGLASYKRPRRIEFIDDFPRTEMGKLQRRVLRDIYSNG